jgi:hypothetical protein
VSWLVDVAPVATASDGGVGDAGEDAGAVVGANAAWPPNLVSQAVALQPGTYVLSWWDQARDPVTGLTPPSTPPTGYVVAVYDSAWQTVTNFYAAPYSPATADAGASVSLWSARHVLSFTVAQASTYRIAFGASAAGIGSVAIADVQLELSNSGVPSTYVGTDQVGESPSYDCPMSDSDLRSQFTHNCSANGVCSYDLNTPILIDTLALNASPTPLGAKLAAGNYNYRHDTLAINLVGTGVHDCSNDPDPNCYGSGYIQYSLIHDATNAGILDYSGNERIFDFGIATINNGKALAAEQYLTMPLSTADQNLITQAGIEHEEFSGRPLDGAYTLRIWDSPDLDWNALQDVQILFNYEYWSAIQVSGNTGTSQHRPLIGHPRAKPVPLHRKH